MTEFSFIKSQFELKTLSKYYKNYLQKINLNLNLSKISNLSDIVVLDSLYLLEFFSSHKAFINKFKKSFKQVSLQLMNTLRVKSYNYLLIILKIFYFPILYRRNEKFYLNNFFLNNFNYTIKNINLLPFIFDIYYKWNISVNFTLNFISLNQNINAFFLELLGFKFIKKIK